MPTPGYVFRDSGTTPATEKTEEDAVNALPNERAAAPKTPPKPASPLQEKSSESHALATETPALTGAIQRAGKEARITNLGWQANAKGVGALVGGLSNDELWTLVRRFNKVWSIEYIPP